MTRRTKAARLHAGAGKRRRGGPPVSRRIRRRRQRQKRGIALILVLGALTLLTVMLTEFQDATSAELGNALSERDQLKAEYAAKSAVNLSRLLIASEPTIRKAIAPLFLLMHQAPPQIPVWDYADRVLGAFNDEDGNQAFQQLAGVDLADGKNLGLKGAGFDVQIVDEDSKIDLNTAARGDAFSEVRQASEVIGLMAGPQYNPMFENRDPDGAYSDRQTICSALIDWVDPDQNAYNCDQNSGGTAMQSAGAEDSFYQMLKNPYQRKNAAFDSLEELHMVRGISDQFWDTFIDPDPNDPDKRTVTIWSQGKVNVNTANAQTLLAVICAYGPQSPVCTDPNQAATFLMVLNGVKSFIHGIPVFGSPNAFVNAISNAQGPLGVAMKVANIKPFQLNSKSELKKAVTTESKIFSVYATGYVKAGKRETRTRIHAVVDFRGAPPPGLAPILQATGGAANLAGNAGATTPTNGNQQNPASPPIPGAGQNAITSVLKPSPGGNIIYYRIN